MIRIVLWCVMLLGSIVILPAGANEVTVRSTFTGISLGHHWDVFEDQTRRLDVEGLPPPFAWRLSYVDVPNAGFSDSAFWFRTRINSQLLWNETLYLVIGYPLLGTIDVYWLQEGHAPVHVSTGAAKPFSSRAVPHRDFVFPVDLAARSTGELLVRTTSQASMQMPARLWRKDAFRAHDEETLALLGIGLGVPLVMTLYNLLLFVSVRDRNHLYFAFHGLSMMAFISVWEGVAARYLWPDTPTVRVWMVPVLALVATFFCNLFLDHFLELKTRHPFLHSLNRAVRVLLLSVLALTGLLPGDLVNLIPVLLSGVSGITVSLAVLFRCVSAGRTMRIVFLAWVVLLAGVASVVLTHLGVAYLWAFTERGLQMSVSIELLLIACALADRLNTERALKVDAQERVIRQSARERDARARALSEAADAQQALNDAVSLQSNMHQVLELQVLERTQALEDANKRLLALYDEDSLTGLKNRRFFTERFEEEFRRARLTRLPLAVLLIDLDYFKRVNDQYGHLQGDHCIRHVAEVLRTSFGRASDCAARFGGEEFAVLLAETDAEIARTLAERVRLRVEQTPAAGFEGNIRLTVSIGLVFGCPEQTDTPELWLQRADQALYDAKGAGRNRVMEAPPP